MQVRMLIQAFSFHLSCQVGLNLKMRKNLLKVWCFGGYSTLRPSLLEGSFSLQMITIGHPICVRSQLQAFPYSTKYRCPIKKRGHIRPTYLKHIIALSLQLVESNVSKGGNIC